MSSDVHWLTPLHYYWEKLTSPSQKSLESRFLVPGGTLCPLSLLCVGIWPGLACAGPVHAVSVSEVTCASALLCLENAISLESSTTSSSYNLLPSLLRKSMSHKWGWMIQASHLGMRAPKSLSLYTLPSYGSLCFFPSTAKRSFPDEKSWVMPWAKHQLVIRGCLIARFIWHNNCRFSPRAHNVSSLRFLASWTVPGMGSLSWNGP